MFERLGIYGMEGVESAVLAGLVTGDPVLLVGSHGTGKTLLCSRIACALGAEFWAYDASKALFEDVLGFPNPESLSSGQVEYVPTPISIWGKEFVLIDELSRANPSMQNKWLEIIRSRRIMGKGLPDLKYVFSAMNPPSYLGAHPLDAALAGRFAVVVPVPDVTGMPEEAVSLIVCQVSEDDAPMLKRQRQNPQGTDLAGFIKDCRNRMNKFSPTLRKKLSAYVMAINQFLACRNIQLDGRRLGMVWRTLQAYLAVEMEKGCAEEINLEEQDHILCTCLSFTMPFIALGEDLAEAALRGAHYHALASLNGGSPRKIIALPDNPLKAVDVFIHGAGEMLPEEAKAGLTRFISRAKSLEDPEQRAPALVAMLKLASAVCDGSLDLEPDDQYRILSFFQQATTCEGIKVEEAFNLLEDITGSGLGLDFCKPAGFLAFRLGFYSRPERRSPHHYQSNNVGTIVKTAEAVLDILDMKGDVS